MSTLAQYTRGQLIVPQLRSRDAAAVTAELCSTLHREGRVEELLPFYNAVLSHELLSSTATSPGWALPHARLPGLPQLCFALGRSAEPLAWFGAGTPPVRMVFLFAVPEKDAAEYLAVVSALARLSQDTRRAAELLHAPDGEALCQLLKNTPVSAGAPRRTCRAELKAVRLVTSAAAPS